MSAEEVAKAFVQHFYTAFDSSVDGLAGLYVSFREMSQCQKGSLCIGRRPVLYPRRIYRSEPLDSKSNWLLFCDANTTWFCGYRLSHAFRLFHSFIECTINVDL
jgi:hypothetical protein